MATHWKRPTKSKKATAKPLGQSVGSEKSEKGVNVADLSGLEKNGGVVKEVTAARLVAGKSKS